MEFTLNSVTLLWTLIVNTAPIFCKFYMKYHLRIKYANMGTLRIFEVISDSVNADGVCALKIFAKASWTTYPEDVPTIRRNFGGYLPNDTA